MKGETVKVEPVNSGTKQKEVFETQKMAPEPISAAVVEEKPKPKQEVK